MEISVKAATLSSGAVWGSALLAVGTINLAKPKYGQAFLNLIASVYPGAGTDRNIGTVLTRTALGFADAAIAGGIFSLVYNQLAKAR